MEQITLTNDDLFDLSARKSINTITHDEREIEIYPPEDKVLGPDDDEDERNQQLANAGAFVEVALRRLYELNDGDEAAVGEQMYEIDKAARINASA